MYLKSLEISGFKSFAHKVQLQFLPPKQGKHSITSIVGPNGSGKSNVSDAIRWVMGEQKLSHMRSKKSEDVIFSGSHGKGQMSVASVTMVLDNTDKRVPVEYDEIIISRKLYRNGESEYSVNGAPVRLLDLQLLLAKAQFAQSSYGVVGQGMIDKLLLQSAQERKQFFDEAVGIKEFQIKRHQAALKLARTKEHITQAEVVLNEIGPRLKLLTKQVKKLEERQEVETALRNAQDIYFSSMWHTEKNRGQSLAVSLQDVDARVVTAEKELHAIQQSLADLARAQSASEAFAQLQAEFTRLQQEHMGHERAIAVLDGKLQLAYGAGGKTDIAWAEKKRQELSAARDVAVLQAQEFQREEDHILTEITQLRQAAERASMLLDQLKQETSQNELLLRERERDRHVMNATGFTAVEAILSEGHKYGKVYGTVASLGKVSSSYVTALDVAAGSHLSSVVIESDAVAESCIRFLRDEALGVATFLPLNTIRGRIRPQDMDGLLQESGVHGVAVDLVVHDQVFSAIFSFIFGTTLIVEDISVARRIGIGRVRMVTLTGDVMETSGSLRGGYRSRRKDGMSFGNAAFGTVRTPHASEQDMADLQARIRVTEQTAERAKQDVFQQETALSVVREKTTLFSVELQRYERDIAELEAEVRQSTMTEGDWNEAMNHLQKEREVWLQKKEDTQHAILHVEQSLAGLHAAEEEKKLRIFALQDAMQQSQAVLTQAQSERSQLLVERAKIDTHMEDIAHEALAETGSSVEMIVARCTSKVLTTDISVVEQQIQKYSYQLSLIGGIDLQIVAEYEETQSRNTALVTDVTDLRSALINLESLIAELDQMMAKTREKAMKNIRKEFSRFFSILFDGGKADIVELYGEEVNQENLLEEEQTALSNEKEKQKSDTLVGIDIIASPPGKKINNIQVLSGGERTMTSIALLCAILSTNPAPFIVLDEVEAALDEANSLRLTSILQELAEQSQFILITHNRATMHAADALYGVAMGADGVSQLLSVRMNKDDN